MTEAFILTCFIPFTLLALFPVKKTYPLLTWSAALIALLSLGLFVVMKKDEPMSWLPVASFFTLVGLDAVYSRRLNVLPTLGCIFLGQALVIKDTGVMLILIAFSDAFFCADIFSSSEISEKSKAIQGIYQAALSLVPAALGVLLHLQGPYFVGAVAVTIIFRLFSWPLNHWVFDVHKETRLLLIYAGSISAFALWQAQEISGNTYWPLFWLATAAVFSLGAKYGEIYTALVLGVFSVAPALGVLMICFWPLLVSQGLGVFFMAAVALAAGGIIVGQAIKVLGAEGALVLSVTAAILLARVFVGTPFRRARWYFEAINLTLALALAGLLMYLTPPPLTAPENPAIVFAATFFCAVAGGLFLIRKKPRLFVAKANIPASFFSKDIISFEFLEDKPGRPAQIKNRPTLAAFFRGLETEAYLVALLGLLGATLLWGVK